MAPAKGADHEHQTKKQNRAQPDKRHRRRTYQTIGQNKGTAGG
jgi:hypothetical protein